MVTFAPNETLRQVYIDIVDDFEWEPDEVFFVRLQTESDDEVRLGNTSICQITIINDDGTLFVEFRRPIPTPGPKKHPLESTYKN